MHETRYESQKKVFPFRFSLNLVRPRQKVNAANFPMDILEIWKGGGIDNGIQTLSTVVGHKSVPTKEVGSQR